MVRILNRKTVQKALIKGFTGSIEDMSFAHYNSDQLACIDSAGDVFIWTISEDDDKIRYPLETCTNIVRLITYFLNVHESPL